MHDHATDFTFGQEKNSQDICTSFSPELHGEGSFMSSLFPFSFKVPFKCSTATLSEHRKISKEVSLTFMSGSVTDAHRHPEVPTGNCEASIWAKLKED